MIKLYHVFKKKVHNLLVASQGSGSVGNVIDWGHTISYKWSEGNNFSKEYKAPANGMFSVITFTSDGSGFYISINGNIVYRQASGTDDSFTVFIPVAKNDIMKVSSTRYGSGDYDMPFIRFIYYK